MSSTLQGSAFVPVRVFFSLMVGLVLTFQCWRLHTMACAWRGTAGLWQLLYRGGLPGQDLSAFRASLPLPSGTCRDGAHRPFWFWAGRTYRWYTLLRCVFLPGSIGTITNRKRTRAGDAVLEAWDPRRSPSVMGG